MQKTEAASAIVEGDALLADQPARARHVMVAQVLADAGQGLAHFDAETAQALGLADAGQFQQLRRVDRASADHDFARHRGFAQIAAHGIADSGTALAVEDEGLGQRAGFDMQVRAAADRVQVAAGRAHPAAGGDGRLAHRDAFLAGAVVVRVVRDPDLSRGLDHRGENRVARLRIGDPQRAFPATEGVIAAAGIAFHAPEEGQDVLVAPAPVAQLRPGVEILSLAAHEDHAVDRA